MKTNSFIFWFFTPIIILLSHHTMTFLHEWTHGFVAWIAGYKNSPFDIHYSSNWLTLWGINEAVPYQEILAEGKNSVVAMIAIAPIIDGTLFFLLGLKLLSLKAIQRKWMVFSFFYWWTLMEISEIYSYIPLRTFYHRGDIFNFLHATSTSPWVVFIPGTLVVIWGVQRMIRVEEARACNILHITTKLGHFMFLFISLMIIFWYFGGAAFMFVYPQLETNIISWISFALVPLLLFVLRKRYSQTVS